MKRELDIGEPISAALPPDEDPELPQAGFELKPTEVVVELVRGNARMKHIFNRLLNRGERINIAVAAGQVTNKGDDVIVGSLDADNAYKNAWDNMIVAISGYTIDGKPVTLDEGRDRIYTQHKRTAINGTNQIRVRSEDSIIDETMDLAINNETTVIIEAKQGAEICEILFGFQRSLKDSELRELQQRAKRYRQEREGLVIGSKDSLMAVEALFDKLIEKVDGYLIAGAPLMDSKDWLKQIPIDHKTVAFAELRRRATVELNDPS